MPHMPFVASPAPIHRHALCLELRVLIEIFPGIILGLVSLLGLPGVLLACVVLRVRLKRRHLVEVFMSVFTHVFFCVVLKLSKIQFQLLELLGIPLFVRFAGNPPVVDIFRYFVFLLLCQAVRRGAG